MIKHIAYILLFASVQGAFAEDVDCNESMQVYSQTIASYEPSVKSLDKTRLVEFRKYLENTTDSHIYCSAYDKKAEHKDLYKVIFLRNIGLRSAIKAYLKINDEFIGQQIQDEYSSLNKAANGFNKANH